jgi:hypothetical protein
MPVAGNRRVYGGVLMRSDLEVRLAVVLDEHSVQWKYEVPLRLPDSREYWPDFTITADPSQVVGANLIEVKDHKHVYRCAHTLGVSNAKTTAHIEADKNWVGPIALNTVTHTDAHWCVFDKTIAASCLGYQILIIGRSSTNGSVIVLRNGLAWARRSHPLVLGVTEGVTIGRSITIEGCDKEHQVFLNGDAGGCKKLDRMSGRGTSSFFDQILGSCQTYQANIDVARSEILKVEGN